MCTVHIKSNSTVEPQPVAYIQQHKGLIMLPTYQQEQWNTSALMAAMLWEGRAEGPLVQEEPLKDPWAIE